MRRRAAGDRRHHAQPGGADRDLAAEPLVLGPGRQVLEIDIGAETKPIDRRTDCPCERRDAGVVDQRNILVGGGLRLLARVGEGMARRFASVSGSALRPLTG
jgi:hypothetical protein